MKFPKSLCYKKFTARMQLIAAVFAVLLFLANACLECQTSGLGNRAFRTLNGHAQNESGKRSQRNPFLPCLDVGGHQEKNRGTP